jgi:hypothetical protein
VQVSPGLRGGRTLPDEAIQQKACQAIDYEIASPPNPGGSQ